MPDDPVNRRRFFREGLRRLMNKVADQVETVGEAIANASQITSTPRESPATNQPALAFSAIDRSNLWLRPPGALPEKDFVDKCSSCGDCVRVCPVSCIRVDATKQGGQGAAYIDPNSAACVLCESLACMPPCPTGALTLTPLAQIRMGTAAWNETTCIRTKGEECRACVEHCPLGSAAIDIDMTTNGIVVNPRTCAGCGSCQQVCPTEPKSIVVIPVAARG